MVSTGELLSISQTSILLPTYRLVTSIQRLHHIPCCKANSTPRPNPSLYWQLSRNRFSSIVRGSVAPEKVPSTLTVDLTGEAIDVQSDNSGGGGKVGGVGGGCGGGGGGGGSGGDNSEGASDENPEEPKKTGAMSMSQKLTLGYAALVGLGGVMGYVKSGSQKSLISGGVSAGLLYYVYTQLPTSPVYASCVGLGLSAALLGVMGSRFKKSGKVFPAGVVSAVSLVMVGGYLHGVMRSLH